MKNIHKYEKQIKRYNDRLGLGHYNTLFFNEGFIKALLANNLISKKEANILRIVFVDEANDNYEYSINEEGELEYTPDE